MLVVTVRGGRRAAVLALRWAVVVVVVLVLVGELSAVAERDPRPSGAGRAAAAFAATGDEVPSVDPPLVRARDVVAADRLAALAAAVAASAAPAPPAPRPATPADALDAVLAGLPPAAHASGAAVVIGEPSGAPGHWGVYERSANRVWVGTGAFAQPARLRYVVAHELGHAWYYVAASPAQRARLDAAVGGAGAEAAEWVADCIAFHWGADQSHYWGCPEPARAAVGSILAGG